MVVHKPDNIIIFLLGKNGCSQTQLSVWVENTEGVGGYKTGYQGCRHYFLTWFSTPFKNSTWAPYEQAKTILRNVSILRIYSGISGRSRWLRENKLSKTSKA